MDRKAPGARAFRGLDAIADLAEFGIAALDRKQTVRSTNRAFREILGLNAQFLETSPGAVFSFDELLALLEPLVDKGNWPALRARFLDDPAKGDTAHFDFQLRNGRVVRLYLHAMAGGGRAITVFDITDLAGASVDALAIEQRYALALDASEQSIWDWDLKTDQVTIGERFWDQIGRPDLGPRVSFEQFLDLVAPAERDELAHELANRVRELSAAASPAARPVSIETLHGEERHFTLSCLLTLAPDGSRALMTGLIRDVTESRQLRKEIVDARKRAEAAVQARSNFLAVISHEIRTPLNGILGTARLLLDADLKPAQQGLAEVIKESGDALLGIINQILDYSRLEAGAVELERTTFDLAQIIESAARLMNSEAEAKGLRIDTRVALDVAFGLVGDPGRIRQIILNLLGNAIKFTQQGHISVSAFLSEESAGAAWIRIEVRDTGVGIAEEAQAHVFDEFTQADASVSGRHGGTGLGLAICRRLTEQMGGQMGLSSQIGAGSTFWLTLPLALAGAQTPRGSAESESAPTDTPATSGQPRGRILVVDDNELNLRVMAALLDGLGEDYDMVDSGAEAIAAVQRTGYDAVLMDMQMPGLSGGQAARAIRALPGHGELPPILAVTANTPQEFPEAFEGTDGFIGRPIDAGEVAAALQEARSKQTPEAAGAADGDRAINAVFAKLESTIGREQTVKLYREFALDARVRIDRMESAARDGKIDALGRDAHDLKSTAGNFGFSELSELGGAIESACRDGEAERAVALVANARESAERVLLAIDTVG